MLRFIADVRYAPKTENEDIKYLWRQISPALLEVSTVPATCAKSVIRHSNAEFTGAINVQ
jgi:hypothetical protein